jgi:hypothetical protein
MIEVVANTAMSDRRLCTGFARKITAPANRIRRRGKMMKSFAQIIGRRAPIVCEIATAIR